MSALLLNGELSLSWWQLAWVVLALTHVTIVGVTVYLHRCQAHRALDLHPGVSHFFRFWLWLTTGMLTLQWVAVHCKHHAYVRSARLSNRWFKFDIGWLYIRLLAALRLATIRRVATKPCLFPNEAAVDEATLQAIIRHRHAVMAAYARTFRTRPSRYT